MSIVNNYRLEGWLAIALGVILCPLAWAVLVGACLGLHTAQTEWLKREAQQQARATVKVDLAELIAENNRNPAATAQKYAGQILEVEGYLQSVETPGDTTWVGIGPTPTYWLVADVKVNFKAGTQTTRALAAYDLKTRVRVQFRLNNGIDRFLHRLQGVSIMPAE